MTSGQPSCEVNVSIIPLDDFKGAPPTMVVEHLQAEGVLVSFHETDLVFRSDYVIGELLTGHFPLIGR